MVRAQERHNANLTEERIQAFEDYLAETIDRAMVDSLIMTCVINNDWNPHRLLVEAASRAGFKAGYALFPMKTVTVTEVGQVITLLGLQQQKEVLTITDG
jgi:hypothetical protein